MKETIDTEEGFKQILKKISFEKRNNIIRNNSSLFSDNKNEIYLDISFDEFTKNTNKITLEHSFSYICKNFYLTEYVIIKYFPYFDVDDICEYQIISEQFMRRFNNSLNWQLVFLFQETSKEIFDDFKDRVNFIDTSDVEVEDFGYQNIGIQSIAIGRQPYVTHTT